MTTALILAGHGSHILPETAGIVWRYVDILRDRGVADEITASFWKEQPEFSQVLKTISAETVVIVPLFTSSGYFVNKIIPVEMGLVGPVTRQGDRTIYLTAALGEHPSIATIVEKRVRDAITESELSASQTAVAIVGHGTPRSKTTQLTTKAQVGRIQQLGLAAQVVDAYLDDVPDIPSIFERTDAPDLVVVPFFLAYGSHVAIDIPQALGISLDDYPAWVANRNVYYTPPIGTDDVVIDFIIEMIAEYGLQPGNQKTAVWSHVPQVGQQKLLSELKKNGALDFGQLHITSQAIYPHGSTRQHRFDNVTAFRKHIRENPFRPLASSSDLPLDWVVPVNLVESIPAVVETVYPGSLADWAAEGASEPINTLHQVDKHKALGSLDEGKREHFVVDTCGRCCKHPVWHDASRPLGAVPCFKPCNLLLSIIKENVQ